MIIVISSKVLSGVMVLHASIKDNRWGNFYSVGASWNMKNEAFLEDVEWVDHLKMRASYGEVGNNMGVSYYGHMALYTIDKNGGNPALLKKVIGSSRYKMGNYPNRGCGCRRPLV